MQELEEILEEINEEIKSSIAFSSVFTDGLCRARNIIINHLSRESTQEITRSSLDKWIPVEERLPEVGEYVLGTNQYDEVLVYHYGWNSPHTRKMFFHLCGAAADIIAWRPLPEPYQPKSN